LDSAAFGKVKAVSTEEEDSFPMTTMNVGSLVFLVVALIFFAMGAWSRWWPRAEPQPPYYPAFVSGGLFFWVLSTLWPMMWK
jgi:hypothetical protein